MGQRSNENCATTKVDVQIKPKREECALNMGQHGQRKNAAVKDAQALLRREECALNMVQRSNDAALKDVQINSSREECA